MNRYIKFVAVFGSIAVLSGFSMSQCNPWSNPASDPLGIGTPGSDFALDNDSVFDLFQDDFGTGVAYDNRFTDADVKDPNKHRGFTGDPPDKLTIKRNADDTLTMSGASPFVPATGHYDGNTLTLNGSGTVAGFPNTPVTIEGEVFIDGFEVIMTWGGPEGPLPGGPIEFTLHGSLPEGVILGGDSAE